MDDMTPAQRSRNMSHIRSTNSKPEETVAKYLFANGFRYRKHDKRYAGKPDLVLPRYKTVIFINGCYWHQHKGCKYASLPKSNTTYWLPKLERNVERDKANCKILSETGWFVIIVWECALRGESKNKNLMAIAEMIRSPRPYLREIPQ